MNHPEEAPKLNPLPFIIADIVLLIAALLIAYKSPAPPDTFSLIAITVCVCLGAVLACMPIVLNHTRRRDALLDERQDQLVAITQTAAAAANQLSIAASNLHNIAETTARMLKHADALPARLQEKIGEFKTQLNEVNIAENEALEQEINTLRASETERLETALENIKQFAAGIIARETGSQKQSGDTALKLAALSKELDAAIKTLTTQIPLLIENARRDLGQTIGKSLEHQNKEALARLTEELTAIETGIKDRLAKWLAAQPARQAPAPLPPAPPPFALPPSALPPVASP
ncbi:MAG: hypothetical protein LBM04_06135, partial [Opitutaceae bacterium]|nr:hypothetical protein [Opitutaceae bacterium]